MKLRKLVAVVVLMSAIALGFGSSLQADASGAPYIVKRIPIVDGNCTLYWIEYSNGDWTFQLGPGC